MANKRDINIFISLKDCFSFFLFQKVRREFLSFPSFQLSSTCKEMQLYL